MRGIGWIALLAGVATTAAGPTVRAAADEWLYAPEGNRLHVIQIESIDRPPLVERILVENASLDPEHGRDINGMVCALPDGSGRFIAGEDTGQPEVPPGWGVLAPDGRQVGKLTPTASARLADPHGCAFDAEGRLFTTELGDPGFGHHNGQLILWFPPFDRFPGPPGAWPHTREPSDDFCKLATDLGTAGGVAVDAQGRVYVAASSGRSIWRFSPPFPSSPDSAGGCGRRDALGSPMADAVQRERFTGPLWRAGLVTYAGLAIAPNGHLYASSVATGRIGEFDLDGHLIRLVLRPEGWAPPYETGTPHGLAVDSRGRLYYADLDLHFESWTLRPGPDGKIWRIDFDAAGNPQPPKVVKSGLAFPDGLGILPGGGSERTSEKAPTGD